MSIAPDGSKIVYESNQGIYVRSMAESEAKRIGEAGAFGANPIFSPDGQWIAFTSGRSIPDMEIHKVPSGGGPPITLYRGDVPLGMHWDDRGLLFGTQNGIIRVSENGGKPETIIPRKGNEVAYQGPQVLPDGDHVLFTMLPTVAGGIARWDTAQIVVQSIKTGERKVLINGGTDSRYLPTGHLVYSLGGILLAVPFNLSRLEPAGGAIPVVEGVLRSDLTGDVYYSIAANGTIVFIPGAVTTGISNTLLAWSDHNGKTTPLPLPPGSYVFPRVSPDGKRIAFGTDDGKEAIIWIYDLSGASSVRRLTFGGANRYPIWSSDSQHVAFQSDREGDAGIFWQRADGTGTAERLTHPAKDVGHIPDSWSPDGKLFSYTEVKDANGAVWIFSLTDKKATVFAEAPSSSLGRSVFSPDGHWLAYQSNETKTNEIFVQPFPANGTRYQVSRGADSHHPAWSPDGKELFFIPGPGMLLSVAVTTQPAFSFGNAMPVPTGGIGEGAPTFVRTFDFAPDGRRFGVIRAAQPQTGTNVVPQIQVVLNWFQELKQRVPVK